MRPSGHGVQWVVIGILICSVGSTTACTGESATVRQIRPTERPTPSPGDGSSTDMASTSITEKVLVEFSETPLLAASAKGRTWVVGRTHGTRAEVVCIENATCSYRVGIAPSAVVTDGDHLWVANASGRGSAYGVTGTGPGYPLEDSIWETNGSAPRTFRVADPVGLLQNRGSLFALSGAKPHRDRLIRFDARTSRVLHERSVPHAERLLGTSRRLWLYGVAPNSPGLPAHLWGYQERTLRPTEDLPVPYGLTAARDDALAIVTQGRSPTLTTLEMPAVRIHKWRLNVRYPQATAIAGTRLWVASEGRRIAVFDLATGRLLASGRTSGQVVLMTGVGSGVAAFTKRKVSSLRLAK